MFSYLFSHFVDFLENFSKGRLNREMIAVRKVDLLFAADVLRDVLNHRRAAAVEVKAQGVLGVVAAVYQGELVKLPTKL